jgi:diacylglycerol kinase family enzyme
MSREVCSLASRISFVNSTADRVIILTNPGAGARNRTEMIFELVESLKQRGLTADVVRDFDTLDRELKQHRAAGQLRAIVAAGGDGTVAEIVNRTDSDVPLTVLPLGTANLLANYLGLVCDPKSLAQTVAEGAIARFDAGRANGRVFLSMVGCGFDGDVVRRLHDMRRGGHISYWTYARPILEAIRSYRYPDLHITSELPTGGTVERNVHRARWAFVVNLPDYGGGLQLVPEAVATDGLLDLCLFKGGSLWHGLKYLGFVKLGQQRVLPDHETVRISRVRIEANEPVPYQLDGDPGGFLPLDIEVLPGRVTLLAPRARLAALGLKASAPLRAGAT